MKKEKLSVLPENPTKDPKLLLVNLYGGIEEVRGMLEQYPIAVFANRIHERSCYPIFDGHAHNNLYGRLMTLVEAVIEDKDRQKAVKDLVSKELRMFGQELRESATEIADGGDSSSNIYKR